MKHISIALVALLLGCMESQQVATARAHRWIHENYAAQESATHITELPEDRFDVVVPGIQPFTIWCGSINLSTCVLDSSR